MRQVACAFAVGVFLSFASAQADGPFTDGQLTVEWTHVGNDYTGTFTLGDQTFPATGVGTPTGIEGNFQANGAAFPFTASRTGDTITLVTGGKTYTLKPKAAPPVNPLGAGAPPAPAPAASPSAAPPAAQVADLPTGYTVVNHTDAGQAWSAEKSDVKTVRAALMASYADLSHYFDEAPTVGGAYEDTKDHKTGGAVFMAKLKGHPVRGMMSAMLNDKGAQVAIVYDQADASPEEWKKLMTAPQPAAAADATDYKLSEHQFPDGTASVGLAEGWTTKAITGMDTVVIDGPNDQHITIGGSFLVYTPNSQAIQLQRQMVMQARQMGMAPPPAPPMLVADFCAPADALQQLVPQLNALRRQNGGFEARIDQVIRNEQIQPNVESGRAALLEYLVTKDDHGTVTHCHNLARMQCTPLSQDCWTLYAIELTSPADSYEKDKPVMLAMLNSYKENAEVIQRIGQQRLAAQQQQFQAGQDAHNAQNARFEAMQEAHRTQMAGYEEHNKQWAADENRTARSNDNYIEMIRGYRTVIDTQTGEKTSADYGNVDNIVNGLNEHDPGRYQQIPLRDENDPVPNQ